MQSYVLCGFSLCVITFFPFLISCIKFTLSYKLSNKKALFSTSLDIYLDDG